MSGFYTDELAARLGLTRTSDYDKLCRLPPVPKMYSGGAWVCFETWLDGQVSLAAEYAKCEARDMATAARTLASESLKAKR